MLFSASMSISDNENTFASRFVAPYEINPFVKRVAACVLIQGHAVATHIQKRVVRGVLGKLNVMHLGVGAPQVEFLEVQEHLWQAVEFRDQFTDLGYNKKNRIHQISLLWHRPKIS